MSEIDPNTVVVADDSALSVSMDDEVVLYNGNAGTYQGLTGTGPVIWQSIQEPTSVRSLQRSIADRYDVDTDRSDREILEFLQHLADEGLIERVDAETR